MYRPRGGRYRQNSIENTSGGKMASLTLVRHVAARPSIVFNALTSVEGIASWWGPDDGPVLAAESDARVGGNYLVRFRTEDGLEHEARGEYLELTKFRRVVMSFRWAVNGEPTEEPGNTSRVEMELRAIDEGTEVTFTHSNLSHEISRASHERGWYNALEKLARRWAEIDVKPTSLRAERS
jgi:uncharacterized protein YndB with AHSA1/START domain